MLSNSQLSNANALKLAVINEPSSYNACKPSMLPYTLTISISGHFLHLFVNNFWNKQYHRIKRNIVKLFLLYTYIFQTAEFFPQNFFNITL